MNSGNPDSPIEHYEHKLSKVKMEEPSTWHIIVRIIEGRDLPRGRLRVRASLQDQQKPTRICSEGNPVWKQNLVFTLRNISLEQLSDIPVQLKVTRLSRLSEKAIGRWKVPILAVITSKNRSVISKWIGLRYLENDEEGDHCGFLKVSIFIYNNYESPTINDDLSSQEIWFTSQQENYCLRFRILCLQQFPQELLSLFATRKQCHKGMIKITCGERSMTTSSIDIILSGPSSNQKIVFNQELFIPFTWPTVLSKISFVFNVISSQQFVKFAEATIPFQEIYRVGENGFMPLFGPSFLNFNACSTSSDVVLSGVDNSRYTCRMMCSIDTVDYEGRSALLGDLMNPSIYYDDKFQNCRPYTVYCAFHTCNIINPLYGSSKVSFHVSMGNYGSESDAKMKTNSCTVGTMPVTDELKYYYMPWGNHKPVAKFNCLWEDVEHRMEHCNAIHKVYNMVSDTINLIGKRGHQDPGACASLTIEAFDEMRQMLSRLEKNKNKKIINELDRKLEKARQHKYQQIIKDIELYRFHVLQSIENTSAEGSNILNHFRCLIESICNDIQISLPDIIIKMVADDQTVGVIRIPAYEVFFHSNDAFRGDYCGKVRPLRLDWNSSIHKNHRTEEFVGILHAKVWFGQNDNIRSLHDITQPAQIKHFLEVFEYEKKSSIANEWTPMEPGWTDEHCSMPIPISPNNYSFLGHWTARNTQHMWICSEENGLTISIDKAYQLQERIAGRWTAISFTNYFGDQHNIETAPDGWTYDGKCTVDPHSNIGDQNGWVYSSDKKFSSDTIVDTVDRPCYRFRRRGVVRTRRIVQVNIEKQILANVVKDIGDMEWEYSKAVGKAFHCDAKEATKRRRRFLIEVDNNTNKLSEPRVFEIHNSTTLWQLRCYIFWAKDILSLIEDSIGLFVRVSFLHRATQTLVVTKSQNPIWNETLLLDQIPIPGSKHEICGNPPSIYVELYGEKSNNTEVFFGSFEVCPVTVPGVSVDRTKPEWNLILQSKGKSSGSLLASFELFCIDKTADTLPLEPTRKAVRRNRFDIPSEMKPKFQQYVVNILCWGLRNISESHFQKVRKPFLEIFIGNQDFQTSCIKNIKKNPNFEEPWITFPEVNLPRSLELSPPIVINLYDSRSFMRQKLIGVCQISKYTKFIRSSPNKNKLNPIADWTEFDQRTRIEIENENEHGIQNKLDDMCDWWSKYYASQGNYEKAPKFFQSGFEYLMVLRNSLEEHYEPEGFADFLDVLPFVRYKNNLNDHEIPEVIGELKGKLFITKKESDQNVELYNPPVEFLGPVKCCVRVYIIECRDLVSPQSNGSIDPYLIIRCGDEKINLRNSYKCDTTNPIFGQMVQFNITVPVQKDLCVTVMNHRTILTDDEIGSTKIDVENRLLTKWRATVGLPYQYTKNSFTVRRDQDSPLEILKKYCKKMQIPQPKILEKNDDVGIEMFETELWYSQIMNTFDRPNHVQNLQNLTQFNNSQTNCSHPSVCKGGVCISNLLKMQTNNSALTDDTMKMIREMNRKTILGSPLQNVALRLLNLMNLVPEHVESRQLFSQMTGKRSCGQLRMFVDIFPMDFGPVPAPIDITPRIPKEYELRVCIFNVANIISNRQNFGQPFLSGSLQVTDLYVKGYMNSSSVSERTDVHYRADRYAEFNWRFIFQIKYNHWENKIQNLRKVKLFGKKKEELVDPVFILELWDKHRFHGDYKLGEMHFDITNFKEGYSDPHQLPNNTKRKSKMCTPRLCKSLKGCCLHACSKKNKNLPRAPPFSFNNFGSRISLLETGVCRGWWPVVTANHKNDSIETYEAQRKKNDDFLIHYSVTGLVEMEFSLLTKEDAASDPVGKNRKEPNHSPYLPKPYRSTWNTFYITSRIRPFLGWCYDSLAPHLLLWVLLLLFAFLSIYGLLSNWPVIISHMIS